MPRTIQIDQMYCTIFESNLEMGAAAARDLAQILHAAIASQDSAAVMLAAANSQLTFLNALCDLPGIAWGRVAILQLDEYLGISANHPASFRRFHREHLVDRVSPRAFYGIEGDASDIPAELERYARLLEVYAPVACVLGIGENGHLAFNDPPADFDTSETIHVVSLDETSRKQQVGEGHFPTLDEVPRRALSLTIPALLKPPHVLAVVPEKRKARAVRAALQGPITRDCPASILRTKSNVRLYLDEDSASELSGI